MPWTVAESVVASPPSAVTVPVLAPFDCGLKSRSTTQNGTVVLVVTVVDGAVRLQSETVVVVSHTKPGEGVVSWTKSAGVPRAPVTARLPT